MFSFCVYVWRRDGTVMYVGRSSTGISRLNRSHATLPITYDDADAIDVYTCRDAIAASVLERELISDLSPILNRQFQRQVADVVIGVGIS